MKRIFNLYPIANVAVAVAGTAVQCPDRPLTHGVYVCAHPDNTKPIFVVSEAETGKTAANQGGIVLQPSGMVPFFIPVQNANQLFVNSQEVGAQLCLLGA